MDVTADLMCLRLQQAKRPEKIRTRKEVMDLFSAGDLSAGICYAYNKPYDTWLTVTEVTPSGFTAHDQIGGSESVKLLAS